MWIANLPTCMLQSHMSIWQYTAELEPIRHYSLWGTLLFEMTRSGRLIMSLAQGCSQDAHAIKDSQCIWPTPRCCIVTVNNNTAASLQYCSTIMVSIREKVRPLIGLSINRPQIKSPPMLPNKWNGINEYSSWNGLVEEHKLCAKRS